MRGLERTIVRRPKILFVHPNLYGFGGAELHCIRAMEQVQAMGAHVTLVHAGGPFDGDRLEKWSGVKLDPDITRFISVPGARILRRLKRMALLEFALASRWARGLAKDFDLVATFYGECTISHPRVLQYIAYPVFSSDRLSLEHLGAYRPGWRYVARFLYQEFCKLLAGWDPQVIRKHKTFANSRWTGAQFKRLFGGDASVEALYPGASVAIGPASADYFPFDQRNDNFVMIGRVVPGKRVEMGVEIVRRLREEKGHQVGLVIIGRATSPYFESFSSLIAKKPWIRWHDDLGRDELERLVARQKWGLHCFPFEHYGFAPAELQALGCVTFVPDDGGQTEIVDDSALRFSDCDDAVAKIDRVLSNPETHPRLVSDGAHRSALHRADQFAERYQQIVRSALSTCGRGSNSAAEPGTKAGAT